MTWTDERVALLKKLWMEGLSASQIASELSGGVTRNAVIGKVHRLKLSARAKPAAAPRPKAPRPTLPRRVSAPAMAQTRGPSGGGAMQRRTTPAPTMGATALKMDAQTDIAAVAEITVKPAELFIPPEQRVSLLQLTEKTCKWPIGDPVSSDFHFCGGQSEEGKPYCEFHSRRAYHQIDRRKR